MHTFTQRARALGLTTTLVSIAAALAASLAIAAPVARASHGSTEAAHTPVAETASHTEPPSQCPCNLDLTRGRGSIPVAGSSSPLAVPSRRETGGKVTVRITGSNDAGGDVTNGGVAGRGNFTASGATKDKGTCVAYRTVKGAFITLRFVTAGKKGTITFVVKIDTNLGTSRWTITFGTKVYKGLHGTGAEHENADYTISTLTGTVSH